MVEEEGVLEEAVVASPDSNLDLVSTQTLILNFTLTPNLIGNRDQS